MLHHCTRAWARMLRNSQGAMRRSEEMRSDGAAKIAARRRPRRPPRRRKAIQRRRNLRFRRRCPALRAQPRAAAVKTRCTSRGRCPPRPRRARTHRCRAADPPCWRSRARRKAAERGDRGATRIDSQRRRPAVHQWRARLRRRDGCKRRSLPAGPEQHCGQMAEPEAGAGVLDVQHVWQTTRAQRQRATLVNCRMFAASAETAMSKLALGPNRKRVCALLCC